VTKGNRHGLRPTNIDEKHAQRRMPANTARIRPFPRQTNPSLMQAALYHEKIALGL
jgi:hypothetical protein